MAEQQLDAAQISPGIQQVCRERVIKEKELNNKLPARNSLRITQLSLFAPCSGYKGHSPHQKSLLML
jgi:hypothetical protein